MRRRAYPRRYPVRPFFPELLPLITYALRVSFPGYFFKTIGWISIKLYRKLHYNEEMRISSALPGSAIFPWVIAPDNLRTLYIEIYRVKFVSGLFLENHWLDFNKTLWEASLPRGDAHIACVTRFHNLTQSYFSWLVMHFVYRATFVSGLFLETYWLDFNKTL